MDVYGGFQQPPVGYCVCYAVVWKGGIIHYFRTLVDAKRRARSPELLDVVESLIRYRRVPKRRGKRRKRRVHWESEWKAEYFYKDSVESHWLMVNVNGHMEIL
jgi:hypothetical protein